MPPPLLVEANHISATDATGQEVFAHSIILLVYRASKPRLSPLGADPTLPNAYEDLDRHPDATPVAGVLIVGPDASRLLRVCEPGACARHALPRFRW